MANETTEKTLDNPRMIKFWQEVDWVMTNGTPEAKFITNQLLRVRQAKQRLRSKLNEAKTQHDFIKACYEFDESIKIIKEESKEYERAK